MKALERRSHFSSAITLRSDFNYHYLAGKSVLTLAELRFGALSAGWRDNRKQRLDDFIQSFVVVPSSNLVSDRWAQLRVAAKRSGLESSIQDAWIAACASAINATF